MDKHNIKSNINQEITGGKNTLMERSKQTSEQTKMRCDKNYITHKTSGMLTNNINKFKSITINMIQ
jgi:hypothetical protein